MESNYKESVVKIINEHLVNPPLEDEMDLPLEEKELDSIGFIEIVIDLEEKFGFSWPVEKLSSEEIKTADDFLNVVKSQQEAAFDAEFTEHPASEDIEHAE